MSSTARQSDQKVAIVTGAGSGIGAAVARRLARRGWKVILAGRTAAKLESVAMEIRDTGGSAEAVACDVTVSSDVRRLLEAAGPTLDALVHSAGQGHCLSIDELNVQEWKDTLEVAVTGAFLTAKAALPKLRSTKNGCGYIIQIASLASGGTWNLEVGYGTAKGAQLKFALHLEQQMKEDAAAGGRVIHSIAICPGTVDTPFWSRVPQRPIRDHRLVLTADEVAWLVEQVMDNPAVTVEELAPIAPRKDVVVKHLAPFERYPNVYAIAHASHP
jgi:NAD(P)-dependent dehydrogenase (short-subunit alcohol dehydrogenase family)